MFATLSTLSILASFAVAAPVFSTIESRSIENTTKTNKAAWYLQNGIAGACGSYSTDLDIVVGLPLEFYNNTGAISPYCGSFVVVTNLHNNLTVTAKVADASATNGLLSMSVASWRAVQGDQTQMTNVTWIFANSTQTATAILAMSNLEPISSPAEPSVPSLEAVKSSASPSTYVEPTSASTYVEPTSTYSSKYEEPTSTSTYEAPSSTYTPATSTYYAPSSTYTPTSTYVAPSTTYSPKPTSSPSSGSYSGDATYYTQNGVAGACGAVNSDSAYIVAIDSAMYNGGSNCGRKVQITRTSTGQSVTATIADECPTCNTGTSLDLSVGAFTALASEDVGLFKMTWSFV